MENKPVFVLIAGGKSERMGVAKGLLKYQQTFWILEQLNRISKSNIQQIYIGLGYNFQHYFDAIPWLEKAQHSFIDFEGLQVKTVINKTPELGSFSTLQTVLKHIDSSKEILFNHIDIPILKTTELNKIIATKNEIIIPLFEEKKGHPIKMKPSFWNGLINIKVTDEDARLDYQLKKINPIKISTIEVSDRVILSNLNTKKDWISFLEN